MTSPKLHSSCKLYINPANVSNLKYFNLTSLKLRLDILVLCQGKSKSHHFDFSQHVHLAFLTSPPRNSTSSPEPAQVPKPKKKKRMKRLKKGGSFNLTGILLRRAVSNIDVPLLEEESTAPSRSRFSSDRRAARWNAPATRERSWFKG